MTKYKTIIVVAIIGLALVLSLGSRAGVDQSADDDVAGQPSGPVEFSFSQTDQPHEGGIELMAEDPDQLFTFFPQDTPSTATVLLLTNIFNQSASGLLELHRLDGSFITGWAFTLGPTDMVRICADRIAIGVTAGDWDQAAYWNFGSEAAYAHLVVSLGVVVDGYVVWNNDATYNPEKPAHTLPLRLNRLLVTQ
jgi:hypothetical protein